MKVLKHRKQNASPKNGQDCLVEINLNLSLDGCFDQTPLVTNQSDEINAERTYFDNFWDKRSWSAKVLVKSLCLYVGPNIQNNSRPDLKSTHVRCSVFYIGELWSKFLTEFFLPSKKALPIPVKFVTNVKVTEVTSLSMNQQDKCSFMKLPMIKISFSPTEQVVEVASGQLSIVDFSKNSSIDSLSTTIMSLNIFRVERSLKDNTFDIYFQNVELFLNKNQRLYLITLKKEIEEILTTVAKILEIEKSRVNPGNVPKMKFVMNEIILCVTTKSNQLVTGKISKTYVSTKKGHQVSVRSIHFTKNGKEIYSEHNIGIDSSEEFSVSSVKKYLMKRFLARSFWFWMQINVVEIMLLVNDLTQSLT